VHFAVFSQVLACTFGAVVALFGTASNVESLKLSMFVIICVASTAVLGSFFVGILRLLPDRASIIQSKALFPQVVRFSGWYAGVFLFVIAVNVVDHVVVRITAPVQNFEYEFCVVALFVVAIYVGRPQPNTYHAVPSSEDGDVQMTKLRGMSDETNDL
jgi:hypothetical protein